MFSALLALCAFTLSPAKPEVAISVSPPRRIATDAGNGGYQAFPDVCRLKDGSLFCVFYAGYTHISFPNAQHPKGGAIAAITSQDEGETWSQPKIIFDSPEDDRDPSIFCLPDGTLLCNYFTYGVNQDIEVRITRSKDGGKTWSEGEVILPGYATSTPIRRLRSGRLVMAVYSVDGNGKRAYAAVCLSDDKGKTWSSPHPIGLKAGKIIDETDIFERKDGTLLAVCREVMVGSESKDGGKTWSDVFPLGFPGHCPSLLLTKSGVLLMGHRVPQTSLHYSLDEGKSWQGPVLIDNVIGAYPSLLEKRDGSVLCVYYEEGHNSAIRAVTLKVKRD